MMVGLTPRQLEFLRFIRQYATDHGYAPSIRDMMGALGVNSTNGVIDHLDALERKGMITRARKSSRAICLTDTGRRTVARAEGDAAAWEPTSDGSQVRRLGEVRIEYASPASGARWRVGSGPWWSIGMDVEREELEASLVVLRRLGVVS
jgi:SOS-response transcriptional repressor LexA